MMSPQDTSLGIRQTTCEQMASTSVGAAGNPGGAVRWTLLLMIHTLIC